MKKIFTLILVAAGLSFAASAQNRDNRYGNQGGYPVQQSNDQWNQNGRQQNDQWNQDGRRQSNDDWNRNDRNQSRDYGNNHRRGRNNDYDRQRQAEYDRMNQDCDRRIDVYRNDRRMDGYERNRRVQQVEYERQNKAKAFGTGMVVGGVAAILIGVMIGSAGH